MNPRRMILLLSVAVCLGVALIASTRIGGSTAPAVTPASLTFTTPDAVAAGSTTTVGIRIGSPDAIDVVEVTVASDDVMTTFDVPVDAGGAVLEIGSPVTDRVGVVSVLATTRDGVVHGSFVVTPGPASEIDPLAGPRTIVADGADETMVVTVPVDALGNPLPDGTVVTVGVHRPDGMVEDLSTTTENGIAAVRFPSTTVAGPLAIAASSGDARGPAVRVDQVAGRPAPFSLLVPEADADRPRFADGRTLHDLVTTELVDEYGNVLPDGVSVDVRFDTPRGPGRLTAVVIAGRAEFQIEAPDTAGNVVLDATVDGVTGTPITLSFDTAIASIPARLEYEDDTPVVVVGPVLDRRGAFVPDGTVATVGATRATIQNGMARVVLDDTVAGTLTISVLGSTTDLEVTP